ncbi:MAG: menaquinone biosynthesis protein [Thermodesulfovibrionales bacterium]|nr:menaquinone biosynthesis protein [Thermodesulfovibrionales bacterium]
MSHKLKIGEIPYLNLFPIYFTLKKNCDCSDYLFYEGVPTKLNAMIRAGHIDISPSSSIEYIKNSHLYELIDGHSISCFGCVSSILLFSKKPINELNGSVIHVTSHSETSVALLRIIFREFLSSTIDIVVSDKPEKTGEDAFFLIGDEALRYAKGLSNSSFFIYDLGDIWTEHTGLPFVFALWIVRKELLRDKNRLAILLRFIDNLNKAKKSFRENTEEVAQLASTFFENFSQEEIISYWEKINYDLNFSHKKALDLFKKYLRKL